MQGLKYLRLLISSQIKHQCQFTLLKPQQTCVTPFKTFITTNSKLCSWGYSNHNGKQLKLIRGSLRSQVTRKSMSVLRAHLNLCCQERSNEVQHAPLQHNRKSEVGQAVEIQNIEYRCLHTLLNDITNFKNYLLPNV